MDHKSESEVVVPISESPIRADLLMVVLPSNWRAEYLRVSPHAIIDVRNCLSECYYGLSTTISSEATRSNLPIEARQRLLHSTFQRPRCQLRSGSDCATPPLSHLPILLTQQPRPRSLPYYHHVHCHNLTHGPIARLND